MNGNLSSGNRMGRRAGARGAKARPPSGTTGVNTRHAGGPYGAHAPPRWVPTQIRPRGNREGDRAQASERRAAAHPVRLIGGHRLALRGADGDFDPLLVQSGAARDPRGPDSRREMGSARLDALGDDADGGFGGKILPAGLPGKGHCVVGGAAGARGDPKAVASLSRGEMTSPIPPKAGATFYRT